QADALLAARARGVPVRVIVDPAPYRDPARLWHAYNVDRLHAAGVDIRQHTGAGGGRDGLTLLHGQGLVVVGPAVWAPPGPDSARAHHAFLTKPWIFDHAVAYFERLWQGREDGGAPPLEPQPPD